MWFFCRVWELWHWTENALSRHEARASFRALPDGIYLRSALCALRARLKTWKISSLLSSCLIDITATCTYCTYKSTSRYCRATIADGRATMWYFESQWPYTYMPVSRRLSSCMALPQVSPPRQPLARWGGSNVSRPKTQTINIAKSTFLATNEPNGTTNNI